MPIFQVTPKELRPISETTFGAERIMERKDFQRMLREQISVLDDRLMVIAEEFGDWLDSSRRIDLLCIDSEANLVVVELKRTEDGGHMELQALRYAAVISAMTFDQLVDTFARYRSKATPDNEGSKTAILEFLGWEDVYEDQFAQDARIVLAAADFSKELTTAVMWLNERGIDIRCVRMKPYAMLTLEDDRKLRVAITGGITEQVCDDGATTLMPTITIDVDSSLAGMDQAEIRKRLQLLPGQHLLAHPLERCAISGRCPATGDRQRRRRAGLVA